MVEFTAEATDSGCTAPCEPQTGPFAPFSSGTGDSGMLQYYECASAQHYEAYFHAIDRNHDDQLHFDSSP